MTSADLAVEDDDDVVALLAARLEDFPLDAASGDELAMSARVITDSQLTVLIGFEQKVFQLDQGCRAASGLDDAEYAIEEQVIDALVREFGFTGARPPADAVG